MSASRFVGDQAHHLRMVAREQPRLSQRAPKVIAITSGKGGVGKTSVVTNLAILLARFQRRVLIFDADLGLANVDVLLGLHPRYNLQHVIYGERELKDIVVTGPQHVRIVPGASGIVELANLTEEQRHQLIGRFEQLGEDTDIILIDTSPGLSRNVISFATAADEVVVITTPEPTAITDAYAMIKVVTRENLTLPVKLLVNMARDDQEATEVTRKIALVARQFLNVSVESLGYLPLDRHVALSIRRQEPFALVYPYAPVTTHLRQIAKELSSGEPHRAVGDGASAGAPNRLQAFFERVGRALRGEGMS